MYGYTFVLVAYNLDFVRVYAWRTLTAPLSNTGQEKAFIGVRKIANKMLGKKSNNKGLKPYKV